MREAVEEGVEVGAAKERVEEHHGREDGGEEWHGGGGVERWRGIWRCRSGAGRRLWRVAHPDERGGPLLLRLLLALLLQPDGGHRLLVHVVVTLVAASQPSPSLTGSPSPSPGSARLDRSSSAERSFQNRPPRS